MKAMITIQRIIFLSVVTVLACCSHLRAQATFFGDSLSLGNGIVRTWVEIDTEDKPLRIGISLTEGVLSDLPTIVTQVSLALPGVASDSLFNHVLFDWNPQGHPPTGIYELPHFDIHFVIVSKQEREAVVEGPHSVPVPSQFIPQDYLTDGIAVGNMGVHYVDSEAPELKGQAFTKTLLYGFYNGKMFFVEPMITRAYFQTNPNDTLTIKQPAAYQRTGYYPTTYRINYDAGKKEYNVVLTNFVLRQGTPTSVDGTDLELPVKFSLSQNFPNPFNPSTTINYELPQKSNVTFKVFDMLGREVATLVNENKPTGSYSITWNARGMASGVYFYRLKAGNFVATKKLLLIR